MLTHPVSNADSPHIHILTSIINMTHTGSFNANSALLKCLDTELLLLFGPNSVKK